MACAFGYYGDTNYDSLKPVTSRRYRSEGFGGAPQLLSPHHDERQKIILSVGRWKMFQSCIRFPTEITKDFPLHLRQEYVQAILRLGKIFTTFAVRICSGNSIRLGKIFHYIYSYRLCSNRSVMIYNYRNIYRFFNSWNISKCVHLYTYLICSAKLHYFLGNVNHHSTRDFSFI